MSRLTLSDAVAAMEPAALMELFDRVRATGGTYADGVERVRHIFKTRGIAPPDEATVDAAIREAEEAALWRPE